MNETGKNNLSIFNSSSQIENAIYLVNEHRFSLRSFADDLCALSGHAREEYAKITKEDPFVLVPIKERLNLEAEIRNALRNEKPFEKIVHLVLKNGAIIPVIISGKHVQENNATLFIANWRKTPEDLLDLDFIDSIITSDQRENRFDLLTGIFSFSTFCDETAWMLTKNPDQKFVIICFDIERFKLINELYGKSTGDEVLIEVARKISLLYYNKGTYCRIESDLFGVCLPQNEFDPEVFGQEFNKPFPSQIIPYDINIYAGIYEVDDIYAPVDVICDRARLALKTVKGNYLHHFAYYTDEIRAKILEVHEISREMKDALENGEFQILLQPINSLSSRSIISAEALVRWFHPTKGILMPSDFIPIFEKNNFITKLDQYIWEQSCKLIRDMIDAGEKVIPISVNVSRADFFNVNFEDIIINLVNKYQIDPSLLHLEITESMYTDNPNQMIAIIKRMQSLGFMFLMDDFGSGYSSLNMIKDVPVNILKIDRQMIQDIGKSERAGSVLNTIVQMAKWLEINVIAEGIEQRDQLDFLHGIGCDRIQGYYFSRPLPIPEFRALLAKSAIQSEEIEKNPTIKSFFLDHFWNTNSETRAMLNYMTGGLAFFEMGDLHFKLIRANQKYYEITGSTPESISKQSLMLFPWIYEPDRAFFIDKINSAKLSKENKKFIVRCHYQTTDILWLETKIFYLGKRGSHDLFCSNINDVTDTLFKSAPEKNEQLNEILKKDYSLFSIINFTNKNVTLLSRDDAFFSSANYPLSLNVLLNDEIKPFIYTDDIAQFDELFQPSSLQTISRSMESNFRKETIRFVFSDSEIQSLQVELIRIDDPQDDQTMLFSIQKPADTGTMSSVLHEKSYLSHAQRLSDPFITIKKRNAFSTLDERNKKAAANENSNANIGQTYMNIADNIKEFNDFTTKDPVTGLYNSAYIHSKLENFVSINVKSGEQLVAGFMRIVQLEGITKNYGEKISNKVSKYIAGLIQRSIKNDGWAGCFDNGSFAIFFSNKTDDEVVSLCNKLNQIISAHPFDTDSEPFFVTLTYKVKILKFGQTAKDFIAELTK